VEKDEHGLPSLDYGEAERLALEYADCMTVTGREVSDELFARLRRSTPRARWSS